MFRIVRIQSHLQASLQNGMKMVLYTSKELRVVYDYIILQIYTTNIQYLPYYIFKLFTLSLI